MLRICLAQNLILGSTISTRQLFHHLIFLHFEPRFARHLHLVLFTSDSRSTIETTNMSKPDISKPDIERIETEQPVEDVCDSMLRKRVLRKIDWRLLPMLGCLYTLALVDRSNVAVARISGMDEDLGLAQGDRASVTLMVFFIGYIIFEIPSNAFIHKLGAANWLAILAIAWGLVTLGVGFLNDWRGFAVLRSLLGIFEAGFFPGSYATSKPEHVL